MRAPERTVSRARRLRREMTLPEVVLWQALRKGQLARLRFRRQHPIGPYILAFYCAPARVTIEVDGFAHDTAAQVEHDDRREAWLAAQGITVVRVLAADVLRRVARRGPVSDRAGCRPLRRAERAASPPPRGGGT